MIFESITKACGKDNKAIPIWRLDTDTHTVIRYDEEMCKEERTVFHSASIKYHIKYAAEFFPERLEQLVNNGEILSYLELLEIRVYEAIDDQIEILKKSNKEYLLAVTDNDILRQWQLLNLFDMQAREIVYEAMIYA